MIICYYANYKQLFYIFKGMNFGFKYLILFIIKTKADFTIRIKYRRKLDAEQQDNIIYEINNSSFNLWSK